MTEECITRAYCGSARLPKPVGISYFLERERIARRTRAMQGIATDEATKSRINPPAVNYPLERGNFNSNFNSNFKYRLREHRAHRVAYGLTHGGEQPLVVMHTRDNPACFNPLHLRGGSQSQNILDKVRKDRQARGSANGRAKRTKALVKQIKGILFCQILSKASIARQFGVSPSVIRDIYNRKT